MTNIALIDERILFRKALHSLVSSFDDLQIWCEANNVKQLIRAARKAKDAPDICIFAPTSFVLPNILAIREIKKKLKGTQVLVIAPYADKSIVSRMKNEKVNGLLPMDAHPEELQKAIENLRAKQPYWPKKLSGDSLQVSEGIPLIRLSVSAKYLEFLKLCLTDLTYSEIAEEMGYSLRAVEGYRDLLFKKFAVKSRTALVVYALKNGIVQLK